MESGNVLEMVSITKEFPGVKALQDVTLKVKKGEIHALVGENGAGKSTLMKVLSGVYPHGSFSGKIILDGEEQEFKTINESIAHGIATIYQELTLVRYMDIVENVFLGHELRNSNGSINYDKEYSVTKKALIEVGLDVDPTTQIIQLGVGQQQLVEIAKALVKDARIIVLDEPTSSLTEEETNSLLNLLRRLREKGITCIYISHRLNEIFEISDSTTIMRDGRVVHTCLTADLDENTLISHMVGREMTDRFPHEDHTPGDVVLEIKNWTVYNPEIPGKKRLDNISLQARKGEILGIAGLMGAGRTELALSLLGVYGTDISGEVILEGKPIRHFSPEAAIKNGICYLSEDRKGKGLVLGMNILENTSLANLPALSNRGVINANEERRQAEQQVDKLKIKASSLEQLTGNLSGGNQQKVVVAKWLMAHPKVLILDEPTRGIDVGAKYEIYTIMNRLIDEGVAIIMISSELPEILGMSDRILVMHEGVIKGEFKYGEATQETIMHSAIGGSKQ